MKIAVMGATGLTGRTFLRICEEQRISPEVIDVFASENSVGKKIKYFKKELILKNPHTLEGKFDCLFGFCSNSVTKEFQILWRQSAKRIIDNSSAFRMNLDVPLIVPEINQNQINSNQQWISNPNCSTIQLVRVLHVLRDYGLEEIILSTYQSVSGAGRRAMEEWKWQQVGEDSHSEMPELIHHNIIPQISNFDDSGFTIEELKLVNETKKILSLPNLHILPTCVRVPVEIGHCISVTISLKNSVNRNQVIERLNECEDFIVRDELKGERISTPKEIAGSDKILIGRIRIDSSNYNKLMLWIVADNLRTGAATNAYRIFQQLNQ